MKSKILIFTMFICMVLCVCTSCKEGTGTQKYNPHKLDSMKKTTVNITTEFLDCDLYDNFAYFASESGIYKIPASDMQENKQIYFTETELVCDTPASLVDVTENGIYSINCGTLTHHSLSGELINTYTLIGSDDAMYRLMAVNEQYCAFTVKDTEPNDNLYVLNFETAEVIQSDGTFKSGTDGRIISMQIYNGTDLRLIVRIDEYDHEIAYRITKNTVLSTRMYDESLLSCGEYDHINDIYYYVPGEGNRSMYVKTNDANNRKLIITTFPSSYTEYCFPKKIFCTDENFIIWSKGNTTNKITVADNLKDAETVTILINKKNLYQYGFDMLSLMFNEKYGKRLIVETYSDEEYYDRLKMKLLAGEKDFDLYIIDPELDWNILNSVLTYKVYEPLEGYTGVSENLGKMLDGTKDLMTYDRHIFGIPIYIFQYYAFGVSKQMNDFKLPVPDSDWSDSDFWNLCEACETSRHNGTFLCTESLPLYIINSYIQGCIISRSIDKDRLTGIFENLSRYIKSGVIWHSASSEELGYELGGMLIFGYYPNYNMADEETPAGYLRTLKSPSVDGVSCMTVTSWTIMNPKSEHKEAAGEFLEIVTSEEAASDTDIFKHMNVYYKNSVSNILNELTKGRSAYMFNVVEVSAMLNAPETYPGGKDLIRNMVTGAITPEEAADIICNHIRYKYFE